MDLIFTTKSTSALHKEARRMGRGEHGAEGSLLGDHWLVAVDDLPDQFFVRLR